MLSLDATKCIRCGFCVRECPAGIFAREPSGAVVIQEALERRCIDCGHCVAICPRAAIGLGAVNSATLLSVCEAPLSEMQRAMLFKARRSVRFFKNEPVPKDTVLSALEDARYAPTAMNTEHVEWVVIEGTEKIYELGHAIAQHMLKAGGPYARLAARHSRDVDPVLRKAPMVILAHTPADYAWGDYDAIIATTSLELALHARGIGTTWSGFFMEVWRECAKTNLVLPHLDLPEGRKLITALMVGIPDVQYARVPSRKPVRVKFV